MHISPPLDIERLININKLINLFLRSIEGVIYYKYAGLYGGAGKI
jgi:hypothetical protein